MNPDRFNNIVQKYKALRIAIVGDFCLDRYLEIDPARHELSIETGLPVRNVVNVRPQPGGAGTILNNLSALGIGEIYAVGVAGEDGEGWELCRALCARQNVRLDFFVQTADRHTFTYTKPLVCEPGKSPAELNRFDMKNWTPTPAAVTSRIQRAIQTLAETTDAFILLEQVDAANTGVLTEQVLGEIGAIAQAKKELLIIADSRRGLGHFPTVTFKMNSAELGRLLGIDHSLSLAEIQDKAVALSRKQQQRVFVTLADQGIVGAEPSGQVIHLPALPVHGQIDIVGAGDAVTANLAAALAAGATLSEAIEFATAAASVVIHQIGTTGAATIAQLKETLCGSS